MFSLAACFIGLLLPDFRFPPAKKDAKSGRGEMTNLDWEDRRKLK